MLKKARKGTAKKRKFRTNPGKYSCRILDEPQFVCYNKEQTAVFCGLISLLRACRGAKRPKGGAT